MKLGDYMALQTQRIGEGLPSTEGEAPTAKTETADADGRNSRLQHLAGMTAADVRSVRFEKEPEGGEAAPSSYDLSG